MNNVANNKRLRLIDTIRGITIVSMLLYHAAWDLLHYNMLITDEFLYGLGARIWQQSICWSFILLSGFSFSYGHHRIKRGLMSIGGGVLITIVTCVAMPADRDVFGVLWLLGSATLLMIPLDKLLTRINCDSKIGAFLGTALAMAIFVLTRNINRGYLGFGNINIAKLPEVLYRGYFATYLGFTDKGFYSSDYFSLIPWFFLFVTGYFIQKLISGTKSEGFFREHYIRGFEILGRHSFIIYMLHQVVIFALVTLLYYVTKI